MTATGAEGMAWSCVRGGAAGGLRTGSAPEGGGHGIGCPGLWPWSQVPEFKEHLDTALRHRVWIWGGAVQSQELNSVILGCLFQVKIFHDSVMGENVLSVVVVGTSHLQVRFSFLH